MNVSLVLAADSVSPELTPADRDAYLDAVAGAIGATYPRTVSIIVATGPDASCYVEGCDNPDGMARDIVRLADAVYNDPTGYGWAA